MNVSLGRHPVCRLPVGREYVTSQRCVNGCASACRAARKPLQIPIRMPPRRHCSLPISIAIKTRQNLHRKSGKMLPVPLPKRAMHPFAHAIRLKIGQRRTHQHRISQPRNRLPVFRSHAVPECKTGRDAVAGAGVGAAHPRGSTLLPLLPSVMRRAPPRFLLANHPVPKCHCAPLPRPREWWYSQSDFQARARVRGLSAIISCRFRAICCGLFYLTIPPSSASRIWFFPTCAPC